MNFKQYLTESERLKNRLEEDCEFFLKESRRNGMLWRGMKSVGGADVHTDFDAGIEYYEKTVRTDRRPTDTPRKISKVIDDWFFDQFHIRARSGALFCFGTRGKDQISEYGQPYMVFPIGEFEFVWSAKVADLYGDIETQVRQKEDDWEDQVIQLLNMQDYKTTGLDDAVTAKYEIMIACSKYYAIPEEYYTQIKSLLKLR